MQEKRKKARRQRGSACLAVTHGSQNAHTSSLSFAGPSSLKGLASDDGEHLAVPRLQKAFRFLLQQKPWPPLQCQTCEGPDAWRGRLHLCLHCVQVGCMTGKAHMRGHFQTTDEEHYLAVDVTHLQVFCFKCNDYMCVSCFVFRVSCFVFFFCFFFSIFNNIVFKLIFWGSC